MGEEFKVNVFFDDEGSRFEDIVLESFEEKVIEILKKYL